MHLFMCMVLSGLPFCTGCGDEFGILLIKPVPVQGIYWTEYNNTINRINKDGTFKQTILTSSGIPFDIDVFPAGDKIYWTEYTGTAYRIMMASLDGSNVDVFYQIITSTDFGPTAIAIDRDNGFIYWNEYNYAAGHHDIWRSTLNIVSTFKLVKTINPFYAFEIDIDTTNSRIYVTADSFWDVYTTSAEFSGSGNAGIVCDGDLNDGTYSSPVNITGPSTPSIPLRGIAADGAAGYVYYAIYDSSGQHIVRAPWTNLTNTTEWISPGSYSIRKIALDLIDRKIYWTSSTGSIWRADLDFANSNVEQFLVLGSIPTGIAIVQ